MTLTKEQIKTIKNNAPKGTDINAVFTDLINSGYDLEGFDNNSFRQTKKQQLIQEKGILGQFGENIKELITKKPIERAENIIGAFEKIPTISEQAGGSPLATAAATGMALGTTAGEVARGAGDILGAIISPFIPKEAQQMIGNVSTDIDNKIASIPGMTPDLKQQVYNVLDTVLLKGGKESQPVAEQIAKQGTEAVGQVVKPVVQATEKAITEVAQKPSQLVENLVKQPIPKQVQSSLKEINTPIFDKYANAAKQASESYKNITPLEVAGSTAQDALDVIQNKLNDIGLQKTKALESIDSQAKILGQGANIKKLVDNSVNNLKKQVRNIGLSISKEGEILQSKGNVSGISMASKDISTLKEVNSILTRISENPTFLNIDKGLDAIQDIVYKRKTLGAEPINTKLEGIIKSEVGKLNSKMKEFSKGSTVQDYGAINDTYSNLVKIRNELNSKLGKGGEKGGSLMKRIFSPSDAGTKQLFEKVKNETGIDLINEATVARYVMEAMGDARQLSLLEELKLPKLASNPLDFIWDKVTKRFNTPEELLRRAREQIKK